MKFFGSHRFLAILLTATLFATNSVAQTSFVTGLEGGFTFSAAQCGDAAKSFSFTTGGHIFKVLTFYYYGSTLTAVENAAGKRTILFVNGKPNMPTSSGKSYPTIGFSGNSELKTNEYTVGAHDFTDDGEMELVIGVRTKDGDGQAIYIFAFASNQWKCLGEMVIKDREVRSSRVFRQTVTIKDAATSVLYTWTYHGGHFDFLSSDHQNDPDALYR